MVLLASPCPAPPVQRFPPARPPVFTFLRILHLVWDPLRPWPPSESLISLGTTAPPLGLPSPGSPAVFSFLPRLRVLLAYFQCCICYPPVSRSFPLIMISDLKMGHHLLPPCAQLAGCGVFSYQASPCRLRDGSPSLWWVRFFFLFLLRADCRAVGGSLV